MAVVVEAGTAMVELEWYIQCHRKNPKPCCSKDKTSFTHQNSQDQHPICFLPVRHFHASGFACSLL